MSEKPTMLTLGMLVDTPKGRGRIDDFENVLVSVNDRWHLKSECIPVAEYLIEPADAQPVTPPAPQADAGAGFAYSGQSRIIRRDIADFGKGSLVTVVVPNVDVLDVKVGQLISLEIGAPDDRTLDNAEAELTSLRTELAALRQRVAVLTGKNERLQKQVAKLKRTAALDDGFIEFLTTKDGE